MKRMLNFGKTWWGAVLVAALVVGGAAVVSVAQMDEVGVGDDEYGPPTLAGYIPQIDSATDDGDGEILISWSFYVPEGWEVASTNNPDEILVKWQAPTTGNGVYLSDSTSTDPDNDLVVDTGIDEEPWTVEETYKVTMWAKYGSTWYSGRPDAGVSVTVQGGGSPTAQ